MEHIHTVAPALNTQAQSELCVAPDIIVNSSARLLCGKDKVYSKASSHLRHAYKLTHELRLFPFHFRKLVYDDKKMRNCHCGFLFLIEICVGVDIVYAFLAEYHLPTLYLTFY